jgi:hypothetical protein
VIGRRKVVGHAAQVERASLPAAYSRAADLWQLTYPIVEFAHAWRPANVR